MLLKSALKNLQAMDNQRNICLSDQVPKLVAGELRQRLVPVIGPHVVTSQWGDGLGPASCEMAHLAVECSASIASAGGQTLVRVFMDVIQAFPSIMVALSLPLADRHDDTVTFLAEAGFGHDEVSDILASNAAASEWTEVSQHFQEVMARFQEDQWMSVDQATGVMSSMVGCAAGVPLAGIIAIVALSKVTRRIQARLLAANLVLNVLTRDAQVALDPGLSMCWGLQHNGLKELTGGERPDQWKGVASSACPSPVLLGPCLHD